MSSVVKPLYEYTEAKRLILQLGNLEIVCF